MISYSVLYYGFLTIIVWLCSSCKETLLKVDSKMNIRKLPSFPFNYILKLFSFLKIIPLMSPTTYSILELLDRPFCVIVPDLTFYKSMWRTAGSWFSFTYLFPMFDLASSFHSFYSHPCICSQFCYLLYILTEVLNGIIKSQHR